MKPKVSARHYESNPKASLQLLPEENAGLVHSHHRAPLHAENNLYGSGFLNTAAPLIFNGSHRILPRKYQK
jgi:hypothetical protein